MTAKPRLVNRLQGKYVAAEYTGKNTSGVRPVGKKVLVKTDQFEGKFAGGKLEYLPEMVERMTLASESGVIVAMGFDAFTRHSDGSIWASDRPEVGNNVYTEKYAGLLVMGNDGQTYRLMEDSCIGAVYTVKPTEEL